MCENGAINYPDCDVFTKKQSSNNKITNIDKNTIKKENTTDISKNKYLKYKLKYLRLKKDKQL